jgi:hypothetical protein
MTGTATTLKSMHPYRDSSGTMDEYANSTKELGRECNPIEGGIQS